MLLSGRAQHIGLSAFFAWIFIESRQSTLQNLFNRHLSLVFKGFDLLLSGRTQHIGLLFFGRAQHIGLTAIFVWIF